VGRTSWDGFGLEVSGLTALLEIPLDRGWGDREGLDDVGARHACINSTQHPLSQVLRIWFHVLLLPCAAQFTHSFFHVTT
jgi:hypothetical protein